MFLVSSSSSFNSELCRLNRDMQYLSTDLGRRDGGLSRPALDTVLPADEFV